MNDSFAFLEQLPNQLERKEHIRQYKEKYFFVLLHDVLESVLLSIPSAWLLWRTIWQLIWCSIRTSTAKSMNWIISLLFMLPSAKKISCSISFYSGIEGWFCRLWTEASTAENKTDALATFWGSFYNYICILEENKSALFGGANDCICILFLSSCASGYCTSLSGCFLITHWAHQQLFEDCSYSFYYLYFW